MCPFCGLPQAEPAADGLRALLVEADQTLVQLRERSREVLAQTGPWQPGPKQAAVGYPIAPLAPPPPPPPRRRGWPALTTPVILLGLGALCVLVAAIVFVTVTWSDLTLAVKAAILLAVTMLIGLIGVGSLRARLRGSTEALASLFVLMVALDFLAARAGGLFGVDALPGDVVPWIAAVLVVVTSIAWARSGLRTFGALTSVQLTGTVGVAWLCGLIVGDVMWRQEYIELALSVVVVAAAWGLARLALWTMAVLTTGIALVLAAASFAVALSRVVERGTVAGLWETGEAVGWLVWCVLLGGTASMPRVGMRLRSGAASLAGLGVALLVLRPLEGSDPDLVIGVLAATGLVFGVVAVLPRLVDPWRFAGKVTAAAPAVLAAGLLFPVVVQSLTRLADSLERPWALQPTYQTRYRLDYLLEMSNALTVGAAVVALALTTVVLFGGGLAPARRTAVVLPVAAALVVLRSDVELWLLVLALGSAALVAAAVAGWTRDRWAATAAAALAASSFASSLGAELTTLGTSVALSLAFAALGWRLRDAEMAGGAAAAAVVSAGLGLAAGLVLADLGQDVIGHALAVLGAVAIVAAQTRANGHELRQRLGLELGGGAIASAGVVASVADPRWALPVSLTWFGVSLVVVALWRADRRPFSPVGGLLLAGATWVRLLVEDVSLVEAYTLPSAVVLVAVGVWRMHRSTAASFPTLTPGLSLALVPSLLVTLPDPTSLRALRLGLAALAVVMVGAVFRWAAPMVIGGGVVVALSVVNLAPYADALPRWVLFATAGAALLYLGMTWESRLRNLRSVALTLERVR